MVIDFDGIEVQMPSTKTKGKTMFIRFEKGKYTVVTKDDYEKSLKLAAKKSTAKVEKEIENIVEESTNEE